MRYSAGTVEGIFLNRPNRFAAQVRIGEKEETVHVKNTGRCRELLIPGRKVWLVRSENPARKTAYDLVAVYKDPPGLLINMDSQLPNAAVAEWLPVSGLFSAGAEIRREVTFGNSRFDLYIEDGARKVFMEVKGVTLEKDGLALFPDAPTLRGVKHLQELVRCVGSGYEAMVVFLIQMKGIHAFRPHDAMHKAFGDALRFAAENGVKIIALDCIVTPDSVIPDREIPVILLS